MSDFDEELEDDFNESPSSDDITDDFEDPQQSTAALTKEINKLRQKNEGLRQFNVRQKEKYKDEVRSFLSPLIQKYKDIQDENEFLKRQIKEISQNTATLSYAKQNGENGGNGESYENNPLKALENTIEEKEREISVLNKMVKTLEEESKSIKRDMAELPELKESIKSKNDKLSKLEEERYDLASKIEAKDSMLAKYLNQINELETNIYVLNKRLSERVGQIENGKVSEYEGKLEEANKKVNELNQKIDALESQLSDYQDTMNSLEEELDEDNFLKSSEPVKSSLTSTIMMDKKEIEDMAQEVDSEKEPYDYSKLYDENSTEEMEDLPSDDELLAHDIELEEMSEELAEEPVSFEEEYTEEEPAEDYSEEEMLHEDEDLASDEELLHDFDDSEIDLPIDELDLEGDTDLLDDIDLDSDDDLNPLNDFELSDDVMDEDRDISDERLLKKKN